MWLERSQQNQDLLSRLLVPYPDEELEAYPVAPSVGSVSKDDSSCIEPYVQQA